MLFTHLQEAIPAHGNLLCRMVNARMMSRATEATNSHDYTLDVNFNTLKDLKGDFFQNIKHPVTERWTVIK